MMEDQINLGCSDEYAELCALSTAGALSEQEWCKLKAHVRFCASCASLLGQYQNLATQGMAKVGAVRHGDQVNGLEPAAAGWNRDGARARFATAIGVSPEAAPAEVTNRERWASAVEPLRAVFRWPRLIPALRAAAVVLVIVLLSYQVGFRNGRGQSTRVEEPAPRIDEPLRQELATTQAQRAELEKKSAADSKTVADLQARIAAAEKNLTQLQAAKASLEASSEKRAQELTTQSQQQAATAASVLADRDVLQQKLHETENQLHGARQELTAALDERQKTLLRAATLERQIDTLKAEVNTHQESLRRSEQYLASDRDVRELMGARQLYIADVFDVDSRGKTKKPFGRVFYTRGKSLIFYAFDLDQSPGYREAKTFQAWGRAGSSQAPPVSLGIFYLDSESNRRWALKFEDPKVLDEINAVFVTVEPKGGSKKPSNAPFLTAYLKTAAPNHP